MIADHPSVRSYVREVCSRIKARDMHKDIRQELESHIEELAAEREAVGDSRDEAVRYAIARMGDPVEVGKQLHSIHRPILNWGLLVGVLAFAVLGIAAMYAVEQGMRASWPQRDLELASHKLIAVVAGLTGLTVLYFCNYRKLMSFSWLLYGMAVGGLLACHLFGAQINGSPSYIRLGPVALDWAWISTYILMIAAAGILTDRVRKPHFGLVTLTALVIVPLLCLASLSRWPCLMLYAGTLLAMTGSIVRRREAMTPRQFWRAMWRYAAIPAMVALVILLVKKEYFMNRIASFVEPHQDPQGAGYPYVVLQNALRDAGWNGLGFAAPSPPLWNVQSDLVFVYLVYGFGWLVGIVLGTAFVCFAAWLVRSARQIREPYGKTLMTGIAAIVGMQIGYNLLMCVGLAPIIGIPLPFISHGFSHLVAELAVLGLALAIYRRKQMIPAAAR